ncbi:MAG: HAD family hydrolase, partial [Candidatus Bipolaricaulia bacterium]
MTEGVIFDLDGTLFEADYDWPAIKRRLGLSYPDGSIMDYLRSLPEGERAQKERLLEEIEDRATREGRLISGAVELLQFLHERGLLTALVTNNRQRNVRRILERYGLHFDLVLTRESGLTKPSGAPLL